MNYYNLTKSIDLLINRFKVKTTLDGYTGLTQKLEALKPTTWFTIITQLKLIKEYIVLYQTEAVDGDLQDIIDDIQTINWFNYLSKANKIKQAVELIETI